MAFEKERAVSDIPLSSYAAEKLPPETVIRPLEIGCSGGGGHNAAIKGIHEYLKNLFGQEGISFSTHTPVVRPRVVRSLLRQGAQALNPDGRVTKLLSERVLRPGLDSIGVPLIPGIQEIDNEVEKLKASNDPERSRDYVDMLLDCFDEGYESAAIWNILQRQGRIRELSKLINYQRNHNKRNYATVKAFYLKKFEDALNEGVPYTEVISTQAMGLIALCDAVKEYNSQHRNQTPLVIHQYMTDLPTKGAVHFFKTLRNLHHSQRQQMKLYACGLTGETVDSLLDKGKGFKGIYNIPFDDNPMVRPGFKDKKTSLHDSHKVKCTVSYKNYVQQVDKTWEAGANDEMYASSTIQPEAKVASIMLGSQASDDTIHYVELLLAHGYAPIFVFGGLNRNIYDGIEEIIDAEASRLDVEKGAIAKKIIRLGNQSDREMQPIMTLSQLSIIRGGGLSVMEAMAMQHNPYSSLFIHNPNPRAYNYKKLEVFDTKEALNETIDKYLIGLKTLGGQSETNFSVDTLRVDVSADNPDEGIEADVEEIRPLTKTTRTQYRVNTFLYAPMLTSGISWEDENANELIMQLANQGVYGKKTSPALVYCHMIQSDILKTSKQNLVSILPDYDFSNLEPRLLHTLSYTMSTLFESRRPEVLQKLLTTPLYIQAYQVLTDKSRTTLIRGSLIQELIENKRLCHQFCSSDASGDLAAFLLLDKHDTVSIFFDDPGDYLDLLNRVYTQLSKQDETSIFNTLELERIKEKLFNVILKQYTSRELHAHLKVYTPLKPIINQLRLDLLHHELNHLHSVYQDQKNIFKTEPRFQETEEESSLSKFLYWFGTTEPSSSKGEPGMQEPGMQEPSLETDGLSVDQRVAKEMLCELAYLIGTTYFKTGIFSSGFMEGFFGGSRIHFTNELGQRKLNIVPRHMATIFRGINFTLHIAQEPDYLTTLAVVKKRVHEKANVLFAREEYRLMDTVLNSTQPSVHTESSMQAETGFIK